MKCINCGADFQTADLKCPYCGTVNEIGADWQAERVHYKNQYEKILQEIKAYGPMYVANKIVNKALVIFAIAMAVLTFVYMLPAIFEDVSLWAKRTAAGNLIEDKMEEYHKEGQWNDLRILMDEYQMYSSEYYVYTQAAILQRQYNDYQMYKMKFMDLSEEEKQEDDFYLEQSIDDALDVYFVNSGSYHELQPENEAKIAEFQAEIEEYLRYMLGITEEEFAYILEEEYIYSDEMEDLIMKIKERKAWQ